VSKQCRKRRRTAVSGLALLAAECCLTNWSPAFAASAESGSVETQPESPPAETRSDGDRLGEVVVTARRRAELLQRVPVSVIALSDKDLEARSVTNLRALHNFVPNLTFAPSQNVGEAAGNIFIRGVGQEDFGVGAEPGVGFYIDGVYYGRTLGALMNITDVARIEVIRGPQGTLFGKNTIGGAIQVISTMPQPLRERRASLILGNDERVELRTVLNHPLSSDILMRLSLGVVSRDGYLRRLSPPAALDLLQMANRARPDLDSEGDDRSQAGRLQLRWLINDRLTADLSLDGSRKRNRQGATHIDRIDPRFGIFPQLNRLIAEGKLPGPAITSDLSPRSLLQSYATGRNFTDQDFWGASAVVARDLGLATVKFIGSYRGLKSKVGTDLDGLYFDISETDIRTRQRQFSAEVQLNGSRGDLSYTAGLFLFDEKSKILPNTAFLGRILYSCRCLYSAGSNPPFATTPRQFGSTSSAGYAQGNYALDDRLGLTLGARYSLEKKSIDGQAYRVDSNLMPTDTLLGTGSNRGKWQSLTYRAGLEYRASPEFMLYASLASGYKSGGFNVRSAFNVANLGFTSFKPETTLTYEVGLRSQWLDRKLHFNATLFHTDYKRIQLRQLAIVAGILTTQIENAASARIRGAEVELTAVPVKSLTLSAAYGHLAPEYLDVGRVPGLTLNSRFQRTPSHSFSTSVNYVLGLGAGKLELHADYSFRSSEQFQLLAALNDQEALGLLGARITWRPAHGRWSAAILGTNLTDRRYRTAGRGTLVERVGIAYSSVGMPRHLGLHLMSSF
jgi:iron complex outermembrane receptor protein